MSRILTEADWKTCKVPQDMTEFLRTKHQAARRKAGRRKLRLFACACIRGIWSLLVQPESRQAVEVAERFADGLATNEELAQARRRARFATSKSSLETDLQFWQAAEAAVHVASRRFDGGDHISVPHAASGAATAWAFEQTRLGEKGHDQLKARQLALYADWLRDIVGNPFQSKSLNPTWLTPTVTAIVQTISTDRTYRDLPILADALEEAGCDDRELLDHLRSSGPHLLGCWALDLILNKG